MVVERATTAKRSQSSRPSTRITSIRLDPSSPTTASATSTTGIARRQVMAKSTASSTRPPKKPPSTPSVVPMMPLVTTVSRPISMEMRAP
jgi:hypothetical protein